MAAKIGALKFSLSLPLYKPNLPSCFLRLTPFSSQISHPLHLRLHSLAMAQPEDQTNGNDTEVQEPSPKIQKLERDVLAETDEPLLLVQKLSDKAVLPFRASSLAAGYDLTSSRNTTVPARGMARVSTDLIIGLPEGTYGRVAPRSGLASRYSIDVGAGVIDADYRGPLGVILFNHSDKDFEIKIGDRIAQLIIEKIMTPEVEVVEDLNLDFTERGDGGFGSTGII